MGNSNVAIPVLRANRMSKKSIYVIRLNQTMEAQKVYKLYMTFSNTIWGTADGLFSGQYVDTVSGEKKYYPIL